MTDIAPQQISTADVLRQLDPDANGSTGLGLNVDLSILTAKLHREIGERFTLGVPNSAEHVLHYEAVSSAVSAIRYVLTSQPPDQAWREVVLRFVLQAWLLTDGDPVHDDTVRAALTRAIDDYRPETPDEKKRSGKASGAPKIDSKKGGKQ